jgi:hypothetical protein
MGITKMIRKPILWSGENQITGDTIQLINNSSTNKIDSLKVFYNTFIINKDSIKGFNQCKGKELIGLFNSDSKLYNIDVNKNAEYIYYARQDDGKMIGIDKTLSSSINLKLINNSVDEITNIGEPEGELTPNSMYPENARKLRGFNWRGNERILSVEDLFKDDPKLNLPTIKGLEDRNIDEKLEASSNNYIEKSRSTQSSKTIKKHSKIKKEKSDKSIIKSDKSFKKKINPKSETSK